MEECKWMEEYERMLNDANVTYQDTAEFVKQHRPNKLYSYRKFDQYWRKSLFEGDVHLTVASSFNDPFDCLPTIELFNRNSRIGKAYTAYCKNPRYSKEKKKIDEVICNLRHDTQNGIKVACFTENPDSILMWSYYSQNHQGFCIEYDTSKNWVFDKLLSPVIYKEERFDAARLLETRSENLIMNPVLYKAKCWEHEREWRVFLNTENSGYPCDNFNLKDAISAVYLGANIRKNTEYKGIAREIEEWGKRNDIPICEMGLHRSKYKIIKRH